MEIARRETNGITVLELSGRLDLASGTRLKEEVKTLINQGITSVHLNLEKVEFINSSGLGALVSVMKEIRMLKGRLTMSNLAEYVREIFDITQLTHVFEIFAGEQDAVASYETAGIK